MKKTKSECTKRKKIFFIALSIIISIFVIYSAIFNFYVIDNMLAAVVFLIMLYFYDRKFNLSFNAFIMLCIAILLNPLGVFGLYSHFLFGILGYDKLMHLFISFALTYSILEIFKPDKKVLTYAVAILIVGGLGSINEISEFIGYKYFSVDNGGIFTISDTLPNTQSNLQRYDTYFDMIFNFTGAIIAVIYTISRDKIKRKI